jgi:D-glycero-D-manno-heptose 1,7-bisphosphate phosphatase
LPRLPNPVLRFCREDATPTRMEKKQPAASPAPEETGKKTAHWLTPERQAVVWGRIQAALGMTTKVSEPKVLVKALFLDLDHTLIRPRDGRRFPHDKNDWVFLPRVIDFVARHFDRGEKIIIITNQGGISAGFHSRVDIESKLAEVSRIMTLSMAGPDYSKFRFQVAYYFCSSNDKTDPNRKPNPGMIYRAAAEHGIDLPSSLFVGDRDIDRQAAEAAGVPFCHIDDFLDSSVQR